MLPEGRASLDSSWPRGQLAVSECHRRSEPGERTQGLAASSGRSEVWKLTQPGRPNPEDLVTDWLGRVKREEESHTDGSEVWSWGTAGATSERLGEDSH